VRAEVVAVGTELLLGQIANTNAAWISERLAELGVDVLHHQAVGDNHGRVVEAIGLAASRSDVVIVSGGLGPTQDDLTRPALAEAAGARLVRVPEIEALLRERFEIRGREMSDTNLEQADVPEGGRFIAPETGTAPGLVVTVGGATVYALPGVPAEMREMMEGTVLPELRVLVGPATLASRTLRCYGLAESKIAELLDDLYRGSSNPTVAYLAGGGEVHVRLSAKAEDIAAAEAMLDPLEAEVRARLGDPVYGTGPDPLEAVVVRLLAEQGATLAAAESLSGGGFGARITAVPGASEVFLGSAVTYALEAKRQILGVSVSTLDGPGPASRGCALEMAAGARRLFGSDVAVALTGAAGPEPHGNAEPGQVWVALDAEGTSHAVGFRWPGDRDLIRRFAEQAALDLVRRKVLGLPLPEG
jgi:nicotinamide-nucleotide amidase